MKGSAIMASWNWRQLLLPLPDGLKGVSYRSFLLVTDAGVLLSLVSLTFFLPFAEISASRDIAIALGLFFWLCRMVVLKKTSFVRTPLDLPLLLFLLCALLSLLTAVDWMYSLDEIRGELIKGVFVYYLAVNHLRTEARAWLVFGFLFLGALVMDLCGIYQYLTGVLPVRGFHASAPQLWTYAIIVAPFLLFATLWLRRRLVKILFGLLVILHAAVIYWTFGRTANIVMILEIALVLSFTKISLKKTLIAALIASLIMAFMMPKPIIRVESKQSARLKSELSYGRVTIPGLKGTRLVLWAIALDDLLDHPFSGVGYGRLSFIKKHQELLEVQTSLWHTHNVFISTATSMGVQGLVVFIFLLYRILWCTWPRIGRRKSMSNVSVARLVLAGSFVMTIGFMLNNVTTDLFIDDTGLLFWLLIGYAVSMRVFVVQDEERRSNQDYVSEQPLNQIPSETNRKIR